MVEVYEDNRRHYPIYKPADKANPATGYYLTTEEYNELNSILATARYKERVAQEELSKIEASHKKEMSKLRDTYEVQLNIDRENIESEYLGEILNLHQYQVLAEKEASLNANLLRIARERANKSRGMDKHNSGYLILDWKPTAYQLRDTTESTTFPLYIINIQTPWDCSISLSEVDMLIMKDIKNNTLNLSSEESILYFPANISLDDAIKETVKNKHKTSISILTRKYRSNVKTGLWEVTLYTGFEPIVAKKHRKKYV